MNKLLIPSEPLQVLPQLAKSIGLNEAIFLQQLHYWLRTSKNEHDGRKWVYNTFEQWQEQFPFWSLRTMQRIAASLVKRKLLIVHKFNASNWDQKNWYSIDYEVLSLINVDYDKMASSSSTIWRPLDHDKMARSHTENTQENNKPAPVLPPPAPYSSDEFKNTLAAFERHRKEIRHPLTPTAREKLYAKLKRFGEKTAIEQLNLSIENGWQGVFEPRSNGFKSQAEMNRGGNGLVL